MWVKWALIWLVPFTRRYLDFTPKKHRCFARYDRECFKHKGGALNAVIGNDNPAPPAQCGMRRCKYPGFNTHILCAALFKPRTYCHPERSRVVSLLSAGAG